MNTINKLIPCIYLYHEKAYTDFDAKMLQNDDPVLLAQNYNDRGADEIIVFDLSYEDEEHEKALDIIKEICQKVSVPVLGAGNVKRTEDIKKLLYAGCSYAALNFSKSSNCELLKEVSDRFGKDKIIVSINDYDTFQNFKEDITRFSNRILLINSKEIKQFENNIDLPVTVLLPEVSLDKIISILSCDSICGISGPALNQNVEELISIKTVCKENGLSMSVFEPAIPWNELKVNSDGLIPVICQDYKTGEVLMMAYMNEEAYLTTLRTGRMNYYSRSRQKQWLKGEESGHFQYLMELKADCDKDTLLAKISQVGAACHTGSYSCFFNEIMKKDYTDTNPLMVFESVMNVILDRKVNPKEGSYTNYLFDKGIDKILKKLGEEATEIVIAAKNPNVNEIKYEISDFLYHMMVLMAEKGVTWEEITEELDKR